MSQFITDIGVSGNQGEEQQLQSQGFLKIIPSLNQDNVGNAMHLWYKKNKKDQDEIPITRLQCSFNDDMRDGLIKAGYTKAFEFLTPEEPVVLWSFSGDTPFDIPIVDLRFSTNFEEEVEMMKLGWERVCCNLSSVYGKSVYLWMKREKQTYIYDITATSAYGKDVDLFQDGYSRIDEATNTISCGDTKYTNFLWYRQSTDDKMAITDLKISTNSEEYRQYWEQDYTPVDVNLNNGTGGRAVYLWYRKEEGKPPVETMVLLLHKSAIPVYAEAGIKVIEKNINEGNIGEERYLCFLKKP